MKTITLILALALLTGCSTVCPIPGFGWLPGCPVASPTPAP